MSTFFNFQHWKEIQVKELDSYVKILHSGDRDEKKKEAVDVLSQFFSKKDVWRTVLPVMKFSKEQLSKVFVLDFLSKFIKFKWKKLPSPQRIGLKRDILTILWMITENCELSEDNKIILDKINKILLQVLENEYPDGWSLFIEQLLGATKANTVQYINSFIILNHMSTIILGRRKQVSWLKSQEIRESHAEFFQQIFFLCEYVLNTSVDSGLLSCALETMIRFLIWIPPKLIYETCFISLLIYRFNTIPNQITAIRLLIAIVNTCPQNYHEKLVIPLSQYLLLQAVTLPPTGDYRIAAAKNGASFRKKLLYLTIFLNNILKKHGELLRRRSSHSFNIALNYLVSIASLGYVRLFKLCMEYFNLLIRKLCHGKIQKDPFKSILSRLCKVIITNMHKPELFTFKNNKDQDVKKAKEDIASAQTYLNMKLILVFLTYLDHSETIKVIMKMLYDELKSSEFSEKRIKSICCAAISIKGKCVRIKGSVIRCVPEEEEERLFWSIFKGLLTLSKYIKEENKMILALNLMNFLAEYADYLNSNPDTLKVAIVKLFHFMLQKQRNVKNLACKTFTRISEKCKRTLSELQHAEDMTFYDHILKNRMNTILPVLEPQQVLYFYEALAHITVACPKGNNSDEKIMKEKVQRLVIPLNEKCQRIFHQGKRAHGFILHPLFVNDVITVLNINLAICKGMGFEFIYQLYYIFRDMLMYYKAVNRKLYYEVERLEKMGVHVANHTAINALRTVRKEILKLISTWVSSIKKKHQCARFLREFLPHLSHDILGDYYDCPLPSLREPEILSLFTTIVKSLKVSVSHKIEVFCSFILDPTIKIIEENSDESLEIRRKFLIFIKAIITHCFKALSSFYKKMIAMEPNIKFEVILTSIISCIKDQKGKTVTLGLQTLLMLLEKVRQSDFCLQFHQRYYLITLEDILFVITSELHTSDMEHKAIVLSHMLRLITKNDIKKPINPLEQKDEVQNDIYVQLFIGHFMYQKFDGLTEEQLEFMVNGIIKYHQNISSLVEFLKNIPVLVNEFYEANAIVKAYQKYNEQDVQDVKIEQNAPSEETGQDVQTKSTGQDVQRERTQEDVQTKRTGQDVKRERTQQDVQTKGTERTQQDVQTKRTGQDVQTEVTEQNAQAAENGLNHIDPNMFDMNHLD